MSWGDLSVRILIVFYVVIMLAYAIDRDWPRVFYFVGAVVISLSVLSMR